MSKTFTYTSTMACIMMIVAAVQTEAQHFSVAAGPPGSGLPSPSGLLPDNIHVPGGGVFLPGAGPILPLPGPPAPFIDVDAFSYGRPDFEFDLVVGLEFSVSSLSIGPVGLAGTAVAAEAAGAGIGPGDHTADIYGASLTGVPGSNLLLWDGDGAPNPGIAAALGLGEPMLDDVDGWDNNFFQDLVFFSVDIASAPPAYGTPPFSAADVYLWGLVGPGPYDAPGAFGVYAPAPALGLDAAGVNTDEVDALAVFDDGDFIFASATDVILFSLAPGSPALLSGGAYAGAAPEDVLIATGLGPGGVFVPGATIGLAPGADLNALAVIIPEPFTGLLLLLGLGLFVMQRRRR